MTLELYVYVVMSGWRIFFSAVSRLGGWVEGGGDFFALCCNSSLGLSSSLLRSLLSSQRTQKGDWTISRWPMHAPWTFTITPCETVCVNMKSWHASVCVSVCVCDESETRHICWNAFWKPFLPKKTTKKSNIPYQQLTVGVTFLSVFLLLGLNYINCTL